MSCANTHGPAAYRQFIADTTGETISQDEWHEIRQMAGAAGDDMGRGAADPEEALRALDALAASITGNSHYQESPKPPRDSRAEGDEALRKHLFEGGAAPDRPSTFGDNSTLQEAQRRARKSSESAAAPIYDVINELQVKDAYAQGQRDALLAQQLRQQEAELAAHQSSAHMNANTQESYDKAKAAIIAGKVTRGTVAVIRFIAVVGIKPLLDYMRKKREEEKRARKREREIRRAFARARRGW